MNFDRAQEIYDAEEPTWGADHENDPVCQHCWKTMQEDEMASETTCRECE